MFTYIYTSEPQNWTMVNWNSFPSYQVVLVDEFFQWECREFWYHWKTTTATTTTTTTTRITGKKHFIGRHIKWELYHNTTNVIQTEENSTNLQNASPVIYPSISKENITSDRPLSHGGHFESQENKKICFCPSSLALDERWDGQNLLFQHCVINLYYKLPFILKQTKFD